MIRTCVGVILGSYYLINYQIAVCSPVCVVGDVVFVNGNTNSNSVSCIVNLLWLVVELNQFLAAIFRHIVRLGIGTRTIV